MVVKTQELPPITRLEQATLSLPPNVIERKPPEEFLLLTENELPWINGQHRIQLELMTLAESDRLKFYCADLLALSPPVGHPKLIKAREKLARDHHLKEIDRMFFTTMPGFVRNGHDRNIKTVESPVTKKPGRGGRQIYYRGDKQGLRVYFMRFDNRGNIPVIIRIAVADKSNERDVYRVISTEERTI